MCTAPPPRLARRGGRRPRGLGEASLHPSDIRNPPTAARQASPARSPLPELIANAYRRAAAPARKMLLEALDGRRPKRGCCPTA